jgi:hypothetical protein
MYLVRYSDSETVRRATMLEWLLSKDAATKDLGDGIIEVDGVVCYVQGDPSQKMLDGAYHWARTEQGFIGTRAEWDALPIRERIEYEKGAAGLPSV